MKYRHFADFVKSFQGYSQRPATTIRPFLKKKTLCYGQLQSKAYQSAHYLSSQGIKKGDRVLVVAPNCPEWQQLFLGCQLIGAILVPVDARSSLEMALSFAGQVNPRLVFRGKHLLPELDKKLSAKILDDYEMLTSEYPVTPLQSKLNGEETAVIIFTSGTTAEPKGVMLSQRNILSNVEAVSVTIDIKPTWRVLSILPLSHSYELTGECCMMSRGAHMFYLPKITPLAIAKALNEYHITTLLAVPQLLALFRQRILQTAEVEGQLPKLEKALQIAPKLPKKLRRLVFAKVHKKLGGSLELVVTGSAPIPTEVGQFWENLGVRALQGYGLTETSPILAANIVNDTFRDSQGKAIDGVSLKIANDGELLAKGPNIFQGYWQKPAETKATFTKDGWFRTGDMGKIDDAGWLKLSGRAKFMIVLSSGMNVFPEDVEAVAERHKVFKEICIVGKKVVDGEQVFAAVVSDKSDKAITKAIREVNEQLEDYQHISGWTRWPEEQFPRTLVLKIDRKNVQAWVNTAAAKKSDMQRSPVVVGDPLVGILQQVLAAPDKSIVDTDYLADLGIDSLRRLAVVSLIEEQLGIVVPEMKITKQTTLADLRKLVQDGDHRGPIVKRPRWQYWPVTRLLGEILQNIVLRPLLRIVTKTEVLGKHNIAGLRSPAIFIFNHVDNLDGMTVYKSLPRGVRRKLTVAQADDFLEDHRFIRPLARVVYAAYNFNRDDNIMPSLEYTVDRLENGWHILMAPEGSVAPTDKMRAFKSGIGLLAVETGAPIVPVKIKGLFGTLPLGSKLPKKRSNVTVTIGQPISFSQNENYDEVTRQLEKIMKRM